MSGAKAEKEDVTIISSPFGADLWNFHVGCRARSPRNTVSEKVICNIAGMLPIRVLVEKRKTLIECHLSQALINGNLI